MQRWTSFFFIITSLASLTINTTVEARPFRVDDIPNGSKFTCLNCHGDTKASYNTDFGSDARNYLIPVGVISSQHVEWTPLCALDSDYDGWTNGQELGDPDCVWKSGDANPKGMLTNPGVYESAPPPICGSGKLEANEACDGDLFSATNCVLAGAGEGMLACTADCQFDYSGCSDPPGTTPLPPPDTSGTSNESAGCSIEGVGQTGSGARNVLGFLGMVLIAKRIRHRRA
jgi:hypothetical protein